MGGKSNNDGPPGIDNTSLNPASPSHILIRHTDGSIYEAVGEKAEKAVELIDRDLFFQL